MHLGNLRTALYAYLVAKKEQGTFILRIEDTDQNRLVKGALDFILNALQIVGINYDEGPEKEGEYGPYVQTLRKEIYIAYAKELIQKKGAYYCFCKKGDEVETEDGGTGAPHRCNCHTLTTNEVNDNIANRQWVIRQIIPTGFTTFNDIVYGEITVQNEELENQILIKTDGLPTYNFANVIDDYLMKITHVIRGSEYLSSTPKYNLLYNAFGWEVPNYIHLPLILNENKEKLSKRRGDANFNDLLQQGYLPQAIINYIALLGWSPNNNEEIFTLNELVQIFDTSGISKSPSVFDITKLTWFNTEYIKKMDKTTYYELALPYLRKSITRDINIQKICEYTQSRVSFIHEICDLVDFIDELPNYSTSLYLHKKMKTTKEGSLQVLNNILPILSDVQHFNYESLHNVILNEITRTQVKSSLVLWPIRTALTGKPTSFCGAIELLELLQKEECIKRINIAIQKLGGEINGYN